MSAEATVASALVEAARSLQAGGFEEPRRHARRLLCAALDLSPTEILIRPERPVAAPEQARLAAVLNRMLDHEPLSRILGRREFWGLDFALSPDTLDPRPETETLVAAVLRRLPDRDRSYRLLDFGTGTGCLLLALLTELPMATGVGIDIAVGAVATARHNAAALGLEERARFVVAAWGSALAGRFDAIVANPPYIATDDLPALPPEVARHDPLRALDGGAGGLAAYRALAPDLGRLLTSGGIAAIEVGMGQSREVAEILVAGGLDLDAIEPDLAGIPRCAVMRLRAPAEGVA